MKTTMFIRKGKIITDITDDPHKDKVYKSINEAKRESRKIQIGKDGALGRGCLVVA